MEKTTFNPIVKSAILSASKSIQTGKKLQNGFANHLQSAVDSKTNKLVLSKHAQMRMNQRNIDIDSERWTRLEDKIQEAKTMGVKDSLVLLKDAALIVSAKNNTVITAMDRDEASSQIFTNINGTIIIE